MVRYEDGSLAYRHELDPACDRGLAFAVAPAAPARKGARRSGERPDIPAARLAFHADGARNGADVLRFAPLAASQAASVGAHREAASHYQIALRYADILLPADRARLQEQLSYEYYLTGQYERAIEARRSALEIWRSSGERIKEGGTLCWLSRLSWFAGHGEEASRYAVDAVQTLETLAPGPELATAYCNRADLDLESHEIDSAIDWAQRAIELAKAWANDEILCHALSTLGTVRLIAGDTAGWDDLERSLQLALAGGLQEQVARAYMSLAAMAVSRRQYDQASRSSEHGPGVLRGARLGFPRRLYARVPRSPALRARRLARGGRGRADACCSILAPLPSPEFRR